MQTSRQNVLGFGWNVTRMTPTESSGTPWAEFIPWCSIIFELLDGQKYPWSLTKALNHLIFGYQYNIEEICCHQNKYEPTKGFWVRYCMYNRYIWEIEWNWSAAKGFEAKWVVALVGHSTSESSMINQVWDCENIIITNQVWDCENIIIINEVWDCENIHFVVWV